jgi:hypothetical protein
MLNLTDLYGKTREEIKNRVYFIVEKNPSLKKWFDLKFMKNGGLSDRDDIDVLQRSLLYGLEEILNGDIT